MMPRSAGFRIGRWHELSRRASTLSASTGCQFPTWNGERPLGHQPLSHRRSQRPARDNVTLQSTKLRVVGQGDDLESKIYLVDGGCFVTGANIGATIGRL